MKYQLNNQNKDNKKKSYFFTSKYYKCNSSKIYNTIFLTLVCIVILSILIPTIVNRLHIRKIESISKNENIHMNKDIDEKICQLVILD